MLRLSRSDRGGQESFLRSIASEKGKGSHGMSRLSFASSSRIQETQMSTIKDSTVKGLSESDVKYDGSPLRIAIVHARWNKTVIEALVAGTIAKLKERGVKDSNIIVQSVPGSFELPLACSKCVTLPSTIWLSLKLPQSHRWISCPGRLKRHRPPWRS